MLTMIRHATLSSAPKSYTDSNASTSSSNYMKPTMRNMMSSSRTPPPTSTQPIHTHMPRQFNHQRLLLSKPPKLQQESPTSPPDQPSPNMFTKDQRHSLRPTHLQLYPHPLLHLTPHRSLVLTTIKSCTWAAL